MEVQGYLFSRPVSGSVMSDALHNLPPVPEPLPFDTPGPATRSIEAALAAAAVVGG